MLSHLAPARRRLVLTLGALVLVVVVAVAGFVVLGGGDDAGPADQAVPGPVLLVPGYGGATSQLERLAGDLRAIGRDATVVALPDDARGDLGTQAQVVVDAVDWALDRTGAGSVDLVGYSAGGAVVRLAVAEGGVADRVRRVVTLASPHHGTQLAVLGGLFAGSCPTACQQLATDSPLLSGLDAQPLPAGPAYVSLWTTADDVVLPPSSAVLEGATSVSLQSICAGLGVRHGDMPTAPLTVALVEEALGAGPVPSWGPQDCGRLSS